MKSLRREYPLSTLLELIGMPRSTYYYHEANPPSDRQATERPAIVEICRKAQFRYVNVNDYLTHLTSLLFPSAPTCHSRSHQCKLPNFGYSSFIFLSTGTSFSL